MNDEFVRVIDNNNKNDSNIEIYRRKQKKIPPIRKTLSVLIASLQGGSIAIELKNDTEIFGIVEEVDQSMTITLNNVRQINPITNTVIERDVMHINGGSIRYIHIPPDVNAASQLAQYVNTMDRLNKASKPNMIKERYVTRPLKRQKLDE